MDKCERDEDDSGVRENREEEERKTRGRESRPQTMIRT